MENKNYAIWLWGLLGLFFFRVLAQLVQAMTPVSFLPTFEQWHSDVIPYPLLLLIQLVILVFLVKTAWDFSRGGVQGSRISGKIWIAFGSMYFMIMGIRLSLGLTLLSDHYWFSNYLPTFFHLVLAAFLLTIGTFHIRHSSGESTH